MKSRSFTFLALLLFQLFTLNAIASTLLTGKVITDDGEHFIGLPVMIPGTAIGTITDIDGFFQLVVPDGTEELYVQMSCWHDNRMEWCGQNTALIVLEYRKNKISSFDEEGRASCDSKRRIKRARNWTREHFSGILAYKARQATSSTVNSSGQQAVYLIPKLPHWLTTEIAENPTSTTIQGDSIPDFIQIRGTVMDTANNEPLIFVTLLGVGTTTGTVTDYDGQFTMQLPSHCEKVQVSYTGFETLEFKAPTQDTSLTIMMTSNLAGVQVCGVFFKRIDVDRHSDNKSPSSQLPLHFNHPNFLLRGQFPGLIVSQAGNDPWAAPVLRHQGIQSFTQNANPIWIVDGMPALEPLLFDQQNLQNVRLLRRPVDLVQYGLQGGAGAIEVENTLKANRKLEISYQAQLSAEDAVRLPAVATAEQYRVDPGGFADFGFATDWLDEVTRRAWSHGHQLRLKGKNKTTRWAFGGSYRGVQGVGVNSEYQQLNGFAQVQRSWWKNRLRLKLNAVAQQRNGERDYINTFAHAARYNPTAPVFFTEEPEGPIFQLWYDQSTTLLRSYFEATNSLDFFNPVAMQAANRLAEERANNWLSGDLYFEISDPLTVRLQAGRQANDQISGEENRTYSFFRGNAVLSGVPGAAQRQKLEQRQEWYKGTVLYTPQLPRARLKVEGGYNFQRLRFEDIRSQASGIGTDDFTYENFETKLPAEAPLNQFVYNESSRLISFFTEQSLALNWLELRTALTYQGATRIGSNVPWQAFWGGDAKANLGESVFGWSNQLNLHAGYAHLGNQPRDLTYTRGQFVQGREEFFNPNPDLLPERRRVATAGVSWTFRESWYGSIHYYDSYLRDPIIKIARPDLPSSTNEMGGNLNQMGMQNHSVELVLGFDKDYGIKWNSQLHWAYTRTRLVATGETGPVGFFDENNEHNTTGSGQGGFAWLLGLGQIQLDAPFGQLVGRQFDEQATIAESFPTYAENFQGDALAEPFEEFGVIGNGLPTHTLGWRNQLRWSRWSLDVLIRGELGHDLINLLRYDMEPFIDQGALFPQPRNYWPTQYDLPTNVQGFPLASDRYVESASYVSLDYVAVAYQIAMEKSRSATISLSGQNLWLITDYLGVDPSPQFVDAGPEVDETLPNLSQHDGQLAPGIDRRYFYPRTRTLTFGIQLNF